jgi:hypothetical protein
LLRAFTGGIIPAMKLFLPSARATNILLVVGFCSLGYALYLRYQAIEQANVGLACATGLDTWLCASRRVAVMLYERSAIGTAALMLALVNLWRPALVIFALALAVTCLGVVLYNVALSGFAAALLILSFARPAREQA